MAARDETNEKSFVNETPSVDFHTLFVTAVAVLPACPATRYAASPATQMSNGFTSSPPRSILTAFTWWFSFVALKAAHGTSG